MAKGKTLNPAEALRKAQRKKELKKNKVKRQENRDFALVKKDTAELEEEIAELEGVSDPSKDKKARLSELKSELAHIQKKKEEYVTAHPEQRNLVYRRKYDKKKDDGGSQDARASATRKVTRNLFKKNGLPKHPERSIYYDPVMNPYGMPPPGVPYQERALLPGEVDSDAEQDDGGASDDSDDDIAMPDGPPPGDDNDAESDDDSIPLPEGPPPNSIHLPMEAPPLPPGPPPLPPGPPPTTIPFQHVVPPIAPQFIPGMPQFAPPAFPGPPPFSPQYFVSPPAPPPGFFPRQENGSETQKTMAAGAMQDPLSGIPHLTFQGYHTSRASAPSQKPSASSSSLPPPPPSLPAKPKPPPSTDATISAEPELRDFKKESTMFVPTALKRKKGAGSARINAAPSAGGEAESNIGSSDTRPDLMGVLREKLGPMPEVSQSDTDANWSTTKKQRVEKPKDDYDKFMEEIGGMLSVGKDS